MAPKTVGEERTTIVKIAAGQFRGLGECCGVYAECRRRVAIDCTLLPCTRRRAPSQNAQHASRFPIKSWSVTRCLIALAIRATL